MQRSGIYSAAILKGTIVTCVSTALQPCD